MFGALRDKNATWERPVLINTGAKDISQKGRILEIDGTKVFGAWKRNSKCDSLVDLQEPSLFPPLQSNYVYDERTARAENETNMSRNDIDLFVGIMCRSIPLKMSLVNKTNVDMNVKDTNHIWPIRYEPASYVFNPSTKEESCYYKDPDNQNLPRGALGIQKCKFGTPFAVSFPHFLHADEW